MRSDIFKLGVDRSPQRALLKGMGYISEEIANPFIGVISSYNEISPGHRHLRELVQAVKDGVRLAGGTPVEVNTISVCDGIALGHTGVNYALVSREIVADTIETIVGAHGFDAIVLIPNCEKVVSGMLMGAARVNLPSILVCGGAASPGTSGGKEIDLASVFEIAQQVKSGTASLDTLYDAEEKACPGCGACAGMPNAHAMSIVAEALGMTLPGNSTVPAGQATLSRMAKRAGMKIMELLSRNLTVSQIITEKAIRNALSVDAAMGGSPNVLLHMRAIAYECGITIYHNVINEIYAKVPVLCKLRPESSWQVTDLHNAGGIPMIMSKLNQRNLLETGVFTVTGKKLVDTLEEIKLPETPIFVADHELERPQIGVAVGNLAPEGAIINWKGSRLPPIFTGPAKVFDSEKAATDGILSGKVQAGDIVVIRFEGPRGGPGMQELAAPLTVFNSHPLCRQIALLTDGRFSGWYKGLTVQHVSPEAAAGGPLAFIQNEDIITIDIVHLSVNVELRQQELAKRAKGWVAPACKAKSGFLAKYVRQVSSAAAGAVTR